MLKKNYTTITIKESTWKRLMKRKAYPSQTFDTIINNLMDYEVDNIHYKKKQGGKPKWYKE